MLILTEKPSVAKDFACALGCSFRSGIYTDGKTEITNCRGHLFALQSPELYDPKFKSWREIPIIPEDFQYIENDATKSQARLVLEMLNRHRYDSILIATDADREGEIIARECLAMSGITDFSRIKRFWVSQALTPEVIEEGIKNAKPLSEYNKLAQRGFARQHSDWLVGINFTRYISVNANKKLTIGRVQTAILSAIDERCSRIENFKSEKYFEHYAQFQTTEAKGCKDSTHHFNTIIPRQKGCNVAPFCRGMYFEDENKTSFSDDSRDSVLRNDIGKAASVIENKSEKKEIPAPQLYNLNAIQKEAFQLYGYSADETLKIIQKLYEEYKCVSYPRTPSKVMGSGNVELCQKIFKDLSALYPKFIEVAKISDISISNKRVFNDAKLEAHHALIPLKKIPVSATESEKEIYNLILDRFMIAFAAPCVYNKQTVILSVNNHKYKITGKQIVDSGWKRGANVAPTPSSHASLEKKGATLHPFEDEQDDEQNLDGIDWNSLLVSDIETKQKWTQSPKHFNEASILSFMENPKSQDENAGKLTGLGTQATRHTFIPKLQSCGYIEIQKKDIVITPIGRTVLNAVRSSAIKIIADVSETTAWEKQLEENPVLFESNIKHFVRNSVSKEIDITLPTGQNSISCPKCGKEIRKGTKNWYCTGYKEGCAFKVWEIVAGARLTEKDIENLCANKKTSLKKFTSKNGKEFKAKLCLDENFETKFEFEKK